MCPGMAPECHSPITTLLPKACFLHFDRIRDSRSGDARKCLRTVVTKPTAGTWFSVQLPINFVGDNVLTKNFLSQKPPTGQQYFLRMLHADRT